MISARAAGFCSAMRCIARFGWLSRDERLGGSSVAAGMSAPPRFLQRCEQKGRKRKSASGRLQRVQLYWAGPVVGAAPLLFIERIITAQQRLHQAVRRVPGVKSADNFWG